MARTEAAAQTADPRSSRGRPDVVQVSRQMPRSERQQSILVGAAEAFALGGYAATSMDEIAAASGITKLIVYRHFDSKESLYDEVLDKVASRLAEEFMQGLGSGRRPGLGVRAFLTVARENPAGFRLLWRHATREPQFAEHANVLREKVIWAARAMLSERIVDTSIHDWAAETIVGLLVDATVNWLDYGDPARDEHFIDMMVASTQAMIAAWGAQA